MRKILTIIALLLAGSAFAQDGQFKDVKVRGKITIGDRSINHISNDTTFNAADSLSVPTSWAVSKYLGKNEVYKDITWSVIAIVKNPYPSPGQGDRYLVDASPQGTDFTGHANQIATYDTTSGWAFQSAALGDLLFNTADYKTYKWSGNAWDVRPPLPINNWWRTNSTGYPNGVFGQTAAAGRPFLLFGGSSYGIGAQVFEGSKRFGSDNIALGNVSQHHNLGDRNISMGTYSLWYNVSGHDQIAIGYRAAGTGNQAYSISLGTNVGNRSNTFSISDSTTKFYQKLDTTGTAPKWMIGRNDNGFWNSYRLSNIVAQGGSGIFIPLSEKGQPNGVPDLDGTGKVPLSQLPQITTNTPTYVQTLSQMLAQGSVVGDLTVVADSSKTYALTQLPANQFSNWLELKAPLPTTTDQLPEGINNKYYTDARSRGAISGTGRITYNNSTGVIGVTSPDWNTPGDILNKPTIPQEFIPFAGDHISITGTNPTTFSVVGLYDNPQIDSITNKLRSEIQVAAGGGVTLYQVDSAVTSQIPDISVYLKKSDTSAMLSPLWNKINAFVSGAQINDASPSTTTTYSSTKINSLISTAGGGDMLKATYDPTNKSTDVFNYNNLYNKPTLFDGTWNSLTGKPNFGITPGTVVDGGVFTDSLNAMRARIGSGGSGSIDTLFANSPLHFMDSAYVVGTDTLHKNILFIDTATAAKAGILLPADWATFNNKVSAVKVNDTTYHPVNGLVDLGTISGGSSKWSGTLTKKWVLFGDSFSSLDTRFYGITRDTLGMSGVISMAHAGDRIHTQSEKLDSILSSTPRFFDTFDICTILVGINDYVAGDSLGTASDDTSRLTYAGYLKKMIERILIANPKIELYVMTPPEGDNIYVPYKAVNSAGWTVKEMSELIKQICINYSIQCIDLYTLAQFNKITIPTLTVEGLHPSSAGAKVIGGIVANAFMNRTNTASESAFTKNSAYNKSFGRTLGTVVDGKEFIDSLLLKANNNSVMHKTGDETASGVKTLEGLQIGSGVSSGDYRIKFESLNGNKIAMSWGTNLSPQQYMYLSLGAGQIRFKNGLDFQFQTPSLNNLLFIKNSNGYIGINNGSPTEQIDVVGNIKASGTIKSGALSTSGTAPTTTGTTKMVTTDQNGLLSFADIPSGSGGGTTLNGTGLVRMNGTTVSYDNTSYAPLASPTFTTKITTPVVTVSGATASTIASFDASKNIVSLSTATYPSLTELTYVKGVTSNIQTQLNTKLSDIGGLITAGSGVTRTGSGTAASPYVISADVGAGTSIAAKNVMQTYTPVLSDAGKFVTFLNDDTNGDYTFSIPTEASVNYPIGTVINLTRNCTNSVTVVGASGVTLVSADNKTKLRTQYSTATVRKIGNNTWQLYGDISGVSETPPAQPLSVGILYTVPSGGSTTLTASTSGGTAPYSFVWTETTGETVTFANSTASQTSVSGLQAGHTYTFKVTVTDGVSATAYNTVTISL